MLKILYILTAGGVGGAQRYVHDLASSLPKDRFETKVLAGGKDLPAQAGLRWLSNRISPFFLVNDWFAIGELIRVFRREKPDIVHLNSSKAGVIGSLAAFIYNSAFRPLGTPRTKVVFTAHGWVLNPTNHPPRVIRAAYAFLHRAAAFFQDAIVNVSEYDHELALRYHIAPPRKLVTIHNGIDSNMNFLDRETARKEILGRLKTYDVRLITSNHWIGSIGRLTKEKNYETLVEAARLVPDAYFFIIGDGPELKNLSSEGRSSSGGQLNDRVFIVPPSGNDATLLKAFDIFVLSSIKEGLPYSLLEAGAAHVPVIVTNAGGMPEVFETFPMSVVPKRNPEAIAQKIKEFFENPPLLEAAREAIHRSVRERYRLEQMTKATEAIYLALKSGKDIFERIREVGVRE